MSGNVKWRLRIIIGISLLFLTSVITKAQVHEPDLLVSTGSADETSQLLLYLSFDGENIFEDTGDAGIDGINGNIESAKGFKGTAGKFNGVDNLINIPSHPSLQSLTTTSFTVEFRLCMDKLPEKGEIGIVGMASRGFVIFTNAKGGLYAYMITEEQTWHPSVARGITLEPGKFHHVRFSYDGKDKILWSLDGKNYLDETSTKGALKSARDDYSIVVGRYLKNYFKGLIDELWIATGFNVMTKEEEKETTDKSLVLYVPFDGNLETEVSTGGKKALLYHDESISYTDGIKGKAVVLKGEGAAYSAGENIRRDQGTIMFWFKGFDPTDYSARRHARQKMFFELGSWNETMRLYWPGNGKGLLFYEFICMGKTSKGNALSCGFFHPEDRWISAGKWHHIATTWKNGEEARFYFDGRPVFTLAGVNLPAEFSDDFVLGRGSAELHMDEFRVYSEPLSAGMIRRVYEELDSERRKQLSAVVGKQDEQKTETAIKPELLSELWYDNKLGEDDYVPPPWEPVRVKGTEVSTWAVTCDCSGILPQKVTLRDDSDILSAPITLQMETPEGRNLVLTSGKAKLTGQGNGFCTFENIADAGNYNVASKKRIEFDGFIINDIEVKIKKKTKLGRIWLEIPIKKEYARYYNICGTWPSYLGVPSGRIPVAGMKKGFEPYIWVGDEDRGFTFCTEENRYWINRNTEEVIELSYTDENLLIKINLCDEETEFKSGQKLVYKFGFMATPSRPFVADRRLTRIGGLHPNNTRRGIEENNVYVNLQWGWSSPWMSFYPRTEDTFEKWAGRQSILSKSFKKVHTAPYMNFQSFGYQAKGEIERGWYVKYREVMARAPVGYNTWPHAGEDWSKTFKICPNSKAYSDFFVWSFKNWLENAPTLNGIYIDETFTHLCISDKHGCKSKDIFGEDVGRYPIFAHRQLMKRIYIVAKQKHPDFLFWTHDSQFLKPPQRSFVDISSGGEPIHFATVDPLDALPLDRIMAEFLGRQFGVAQFYLPGVTKKKHPDTLLASERLAHLLFLHDIQLWGIWIHGHIPEDIWEISNRYGLDDSAVFIPYWEIERGQRKEIAALENADVKVSVYRTSNKNLIITVYNTGDKSFSGRINVNWQLLGDTGYGAGVAEVISGTRAGKGAVKKIDASGLDIEIGAKDGMNIGIKL